MKNLPLPEKGSAPSRGQPAPSRGQRWKRRLFRGGMALVAGLAIFVLLRTRVFTFMRVDGNSMAPTLHSGEYVLVTLFDRGSVQRGDVVICLYPGRGDTCFVKRVVGLPGDEVARVKGVTHVNGQPVDPDWEGECLLEDYTCTLEANEYFVVGDSLYSSHDSRDWMDEAIPASDTVGPITGDMILGRAQWVIWPLSGARTVD